jgi:hypothetical protein
MNRWKPLLATLGVATLLCAAVGAASARNLSLSTQTLRATWQNLEVSEMFGVIVRCQLTLEGSLHARTHVKVVGTLIGYVNRAAMSCPVFEWRLLTETMPWHVRYRLFAGTLPNIASWWTSIVGFAIGIRSSLGMSCLGRSTAAEPFQLTYNRGAGGGLIEGVASGSFPAECGGGATNTLSFAGRTATIQAATLTLI